MAALRVDLAFLLDVTGSMQPCLDAIKENIGTFVTALTSPGVNSDIPIQDWRIKICGFRDYDADPATWFVDNPFVSDLAAVKAQLSEDKLRADGGGDEPESLLDALFALASAEITSLQDEDLQSRWRSRQEARRVIVFFTDATFHPTIRIPAAKGGTVEDLQVLLQTNKFILCGFCPEWSGYLDLSSVDEADITFVAKCSEDPALAGLGTAGATGRAARDVAVNGLRNLASDPLAFAKVMEQLAKSISKSVSAANAG